MPREWIDTDCALCGAAPARPILDIPHPDAPNGMSRLLACSSCGLRRLSPRPGPASIGVYYGDASDYNAFVGRRRSPRAQRFWDFLRDGFAAPAGQSVAGRLLRPVTRALAGWQFDINVPLHRRHDWRVIEVGSGFGDILIYLKSRGCRVLGTDLSPAAAAKGREYGVDIRDGNLAELDLPAASFDVGILCHSLEHLPDPNVELRELGRLLVPGGRLHIAVPNGNAVRLELDGLRWAHLSHPLHFWYFDDTTLGRILERHGFRFAEPPRTTTRHHALGAWQHDARSLGRVAATRNLLRFVAATMRTADGGDVLRVVAERIP